jgi:hypothetical protein
MFLQSQEIPGLGIGTGTLTVIIIAAVVLITLVSLIPMIVIFKRVFGGIKKNNTLLANGELGQAKILKIWDTGTTLNDNPQIGMILEVHAANRSPYQVETKCFVSRLRIPQVQPGAIVNVKIDRQDTAQIALDLN